MTPSNYNSLIKYAGLGSLARSGLNKLVSLLARDKNFNKYMDTIGASPTDYNVVRKLIKSPSGEQVESVTSTLKPYVFKDKVDNYIIENLFSPEGQVKVLENLDVLKKLSR